MINCPLCKSNSIEKIQSIKTTDLANLYLTTLGISINKNNKEIKYNKCKRCGLKFFKPSIVGDGKFYDSLNKKFPWYYSDEKDEFKIITRLIKKEDCLLEVGCGEGKFFQYFNKKSQKKIKYSGIELNNDAVNLGKKKKINIFNISIQEFSKRNEKFDVVMSIQVLEHIADIRKFITASFSCVKKGGILVISVPSDDSFVGRSINSALNLPPHHQSRWSDETLKYIAKILKVAEPTIIHESISPIHKEWYYREKLLSLFTKIKDNDIVFSNNLLLRPINILLYPISFLLSILLKPNKRIYGHSVIAVFKKT